MSYREILRSDNIHPAENAGKYPYLLSGPNLDDPSALTLNPKRYFSSNEKLDLKNKKGNYISILLEFPNVTFVAPVRFLIAPDG